MPRLTTNVFPPASRASLTVRRARRDDLCPDVQTDRRKDTVRIGNNRYTDPCLPYHYYRKRHRNPKLGTGNAARLSKKIPVRNRYKKKRPTGKDQSLAVLSTPFVQLGGERGIRTPGGVTLNGFQDRRNRPLCHLSGKPFGFTAQMYKDFPKPQQKPNNESLKRTPNVNLS